MYGELHSLRVGKGNKSLASVKYRTRFLGFSALSLVGILFTLLRLRTRAFHVGVNVDKIRCFIRNSAP